MNIPREDLTIQNIERTLHYVLYDLDGTPRDTIEQPDTGFELAMLISSGSRESGLIPSTTRLPFTPQEWKILTPSGHFIVATADRYALNIQGNGRPFRIERDLARVPVDPDESDHHREMVFTLMRQVEPGWQWSGPSIPDEKPFFRSVSLADDGRIWVLLSKVARRLDDDDSPLGVTWREPTAYDVWEPTGEYLGEVAVPENTRIFVMRGDDVWGVARDSLDVPRVVRYRIIPGLGTN
jgi:hypothetical protein